ncbi:hypothetical protein FRC04_006259 [Tulasnella sp. 424]|nr:hypothetical protein FRC04_006259 [Tulasnella sp. 424]KAG8961173.1 hypothetical protein FRC05_006285 [Tulasnella sp. 425]
MTSSNDPMARPRNVTRASDDSLDSIASLSSDGDQPNRPPARPTVTASNGGSSSSAGSSSASTPATSDASLDTQKENVGVPIGQILLPGQPIVSSQHRAVDRFKEWEVANAKYLVGLDIHKKWNLYISKADLSKLATKA